MDKLYVSAQAKNISIEDIDYLESGRFTIDVGDTLFETFYSYNHQYNDILICFLNGSRTKGSSPVFKRWSWYEFIPGCMLNIDDPMINDYPELSLGWYYGSENKSYCDGVVRIINKYAELLNAQRVIFYSSSGGATAAIYCGSMIPGSISICINPQIYITDYGYSSEFQNITRYNLHEPDALHRNDLGVIISSSEKSKYILVENLESDSDIKQISKLYNRTNRKMDCTAGLDILKDNVIVWKYKALGYSNYASAAHNSQDWKNMFWPIFRLSNYFFDNRCFDDWKEEYDNYSRFWSEKYELENKIEALRRNNKLYDCKDGNISYYPELVIDGCLSDVWKHIKIDYDFKKDNLYEIIVDGYENPNNVLTIVIKDMKNNSILSKSTVNSPRYKSYFVCNDNTDIEFRIYPCLLGKQSVCDSVKIYGFSIKLI